MEEANIEAWFKRSRVVRRTVGGYSPYKSTSGGYANTKSAGGYIVANNGNNGSTGTRNIDLVKKVYSY